MTERLMLSGSTATALFPSKKTAIALSNKSDRAQLMNSDYTMTIIREIPLGDNHVWVMIGDRVSVVRQDFKRLGKDDRLCKYKAICIGTDSFPEARKIVARLLPHIPPFRVQVRLAERVLDWQLEVKASGDFDLCWIEWVADNVDSVLDGSLPLSLEDREALAFTSLVSPILD